jgi:hypothetical protein
VAAAGDRRGHGTESFLPSRQVVAANRDLMEAVGIEPRNVPITIAPGFEVKGVALSCSGPGLFEQIAIDSMNSCFNRVGWSRLSEPPFETTTFGA